MAERDVFTDTQIQEYLDGRLSERDRATVAAYLLAHPKVAAEVEAIRRQGDALSALGQEILDEPVPERLHQALRKGSLRAKREAPPPRILRRPTFGRPPNFLEAAAAILLFFAGGALGWLARDLARPVPSVGDALLADISRAYALYGAPGYPVDFPPERAADFVTWIGQSFEREVPPPDLADFGYTYRGGRLIPAADNRIGLFQFDRAEHGGLAVFFWTTAAPPDVVRSLSARERVAARFWNTDGLSFAVISDRANGDLEAAAQAIFSFYADASDPR